MQNIDNIIKFQYDWNVIQEDHNSGLYLTEIISKYNINKLRLNRAVKLGLFQKIIHPRIQTEESRKIISQKRKEYLKANPDKHVWKNNNKFKSNPCEHFKNLLKENNINFVSEFEPLNDRLFSIDIAFPSIKLGLEINGNQHYNKDKSLKPYYQKRKDLIVTAGWKLYDIHYSLVFKKEITDQLINELINVHDVKNIDLNFNFTKNDNNLKLVKEKYSSIIKENLCMLCKSKISLRATYCKKCATTLSNAKRIKFHISKEELFDLKVNKKYSNVKIGKMFNVSDVTVKKYIKKYAI